MLFTATTKENLAPRLNGIHRFFMQSYPCGHTPNFLLSFALLLEKSVRGKEKVKRTKGL